MYDAGRMSGHFGIRKRVASRGAGRRVWILPACMLLLFPSLLKADVIYLKNGGKIVAQVTKENAKQVFYEMGGGEFALPKSLPWKAHKSKQVLSELAFSVFEKLPHTQRL